MSQYPTWMKPHLRARLEQEKADKERTGPKQGEPALVADEKGRIKTITTDHGKAPPSKVFVQVEGRTVEGLLMSSAGNICCVGIQSVIGTVFVYRRPDELVHVADLVPLAPSVQNPNYGGASLHGNRWREEQERSE